MRTFVMPVSVFLGLCLACCFSGVVEAAQDSGDAGVLENCAWTLSQIMKFQLDENGRLELNRDHWEIAAKRPLEKSENPLVNSRFQNQEDLPPIEKLFQRLIAEAGSGGVSSSSRNMEKEISWDGTQSEGRLRIGGTEMVVSLFEQSKESRRLFFRTQGEDVELTFLSPEGKLLQLRQSKDAVRICSLWSGEPKVVSGPTFAAMVQQNREYFQNLEWPSFIGELPVNESLEVKVTGGSEAVTFPEPQLSEAMFLSDRCRASYLVFTRFRIVDRRLRFNDFYGNADLLAKETETLSKEFGEALDRSLQRMNDMDAPPIQVGQIRARFGGWQAEKPNAAAGARKVSVLLAAFEKLQSLAGNRSSGSSMGGSSFRRTFESSDISASISGDTDALSFRVSDDPVVVDFSQDASGFVLTASDEQSILSIREQSDQSAVLTILQGDFCRVWKARSWLDLVAENEAEFRKHVVPILDHYAIEGLDPFEPELVKAAVKRLQEDLPETLDLDAVVGNSDSYILPLLWNERFLQLLAEKVAAGDADLVKARLRAISGK